MILKKGTLIHEESPFVHVLSSALRKERCDHCFEKTDVHMCSGCRYVGYCDRVCQKAGWVHHKQECPRLRLLPPSRELPNAARVLSRIILKLKRGGDMEKGIYSKQSFRVFKDLMSHYSDLKKDEKRMEHLSALKGVLTDYLGESELPNIAELMGMFGRMVINAFNILDADMVEIGTGIYLGASTIDHSCRPNSVAIFQGTTIYIRALEDIPDYNWNKVRISYIELLKCRTERQTELQQNYYFSCDCNRCSDSGDILLETAMLCPTSSCGAPLPLPNNQMKEIISCPECTHQVPKSHVEKFLEAYEFTKEQHKIMKSVTYLDVCKVCLRKQEGTFHPLNVYYTSTLDMGFESAIQLARWSDALSLGHSLTPGLRHWCGGTHPLLGLHHLRLGMILLLEGQDEQAQRELDRAEAILRITHSTSSRLYTRKLLPLLHQAHAI